MGGATFQKMKEVHDKHMACVERKYLPKATIVHHLLLLQEVFGIPSDPILFGLPESITVITFYGTESGSFLFFNTFVLSN